MKSERLGIIFVVLFSLAVLFLLILILGDDPVRSFYFFFIGPFRNVFNFGNMLNAAVPLMLGALGIIIAMKAGNLNLGGEGQIYLGAFITTITALALPLSGFMGAIFAVLAGSICAGALGAISGVCKAKWNVNELISSFLLSCAVLPIINYMVQGPFLNQETSLISTEKIAESMRLPLILRPSNLNVGFFIALLFIFLIQYFLNKTRMGYEFRMAGHNEMFARYGGINTKLNTVLSLFFSGSLYGLAGSIAVLGTHYAVIKEFSAGLGWSGLTVALIAGFSPAAVLPCALFLSWINSGARIAMQNTGLTYEIAVIVQAVIFLLSTSLAIRTAFNKKRKV